MNSKVLNMKICFRGTTMASMFTCTIFPPNSTNLIEFERMPEFEHETYMCLHISNSGLIHALLQWGEELFGLEENTQVVGSSWFVTNQFTMEVIFHKRMRRY
jgi:hypothetical protein